MRLDADVGDRDRKRESARGAHGERCDDLAHIGAGTGETLEPMEAEPRQ